ncbi:MAG: hypothetical protein IKO72_01060, partial [Kiritimatiellae bacterium]|nr:hypothetical protein [Kiritimatiellia bacterium]
MKILREEKSLGKCCQCANVASTNSNNQSAFAKTSTSAKATVDKSLGKCCQCANVASTNSNNQSAFAKTSTSAKATVDKS